MKNQKNQFKFVKSFLLLMFLQSFLHGQGVNGGYPGPGNTTIWDKGPEIYVINNNENTDNDDLTYIDCEKHPKLCDDLREKNPRPGTPPAEPKDPKDPKKPKQPKDPKQPKKPKKQSLPSGITDEIINEVRQSSKTGMVVIKNGKWVDIFDFDGHIESLTKNK